MTTVVWENEEAFENAKKTVATEFEKQGFGLQETRRKLKIESERASMKEHPTERRSNFAWQALGLRVT